MGFWAGKRKRNKEITIPDKTIGMLRRYYKIYRPKVEFCKIIGGTFENIFEKPDDDSELIFIKGGNDGIVFTFKKGKLLTFEHWSPCLN